MTERIKESELILPALKLMRDAPNGFIPTSDLIDALIKIFMPKGKDAQIIHGRNDSHFSQKVRNLVSHRNEDSGLVGNGWATYNSESHGLTITQSGKTHLQNNGY